MSIVDHRAGVDQEFFMGEGWLVPCGCKVAESMLQFENCNLTENHFTRNTSNATKSLSHFLVWRWKVGPNSYYKLVHV